MQGFCVSVIAWNLEDVAIVDTKQLSWQKEQVGSEFVESGFLEILGQNHAFEIAGQTEREQHQMEVGLIGSEIVGGDFADGIIPLELTDKKFCLSAAFVEAPDRVRF